MNKIYVVTSGDYSDYGIDAIFSTKELAQKFIDSFKESCWYERRIEEHNLDPNKEDILSNRKPFFVRIDRYGKVRDVEWEDSPSGFSDDFVYNFTVDDVFMNVHCFANDEKHAIKIANERRVQILANNLWAVRKIIEQ